MILVTSEGHRLRRSFESRNLLGWSSVPNCVDVARCNLILCNRTSDGALNPVYQAILHESRRYCRAPEETFSTGIIVVATLASHTEA